jgi:protein-S-isoprenylcysteine O-methyltransferase Ste14
MAQSDRPILFGGWLPPRMFLLSLALQTPGIALLWPPRPNAIELAAGVAIVSGVLFNLVFAAALAAWLNWAYILPEERFFSQRFGAQN